jgi:hypothetical protein
MAHHDHAASESLALSRPLVTQADRYQWQRAAVRELAAILEAHADLPAITWTIGPTGSLKGSVISGLAADAEARVTFGAWRRALRLGAIGDHPVSNNTAMHLRGSVRRNGIKITVTASVPANVDEEPVVAGTAAPVPREATQSAPRSLAALARRRPSHDALERLPGTRTRGSTDKAPLAPPHLPDGPQPVHVR